MWVKIILFTYCIAIFRAYALKTCVPKTFGGKNNPMACVCNSTYCDEFPPLGTLQPGQAAIYTTSQSGRRFERTDQIFNANGTASTIQFTLNTSTRFQKIIGFGGAFTDASGYLFLNLSQNARQNLINAYFADEGIGYTIGRVPMGSCDFSLEFFTYDNVDGDFNLTTFALAPEDLNIKIPFIKAAQSIIGSKLKLFSTPWTAPKWMKTDQVISGYWTLKGDVGGPYYQTWANYFIRFYEEYYKQGIPFWGLTVQNEPNSGQQNDEQMHFTPEMERDFIKLILGPTIRNNNLTKNMKFMMLDDGLLRLLSVAETVLSDPDAAKYVDGYGIHWYDDSVSGSETWIDQVHQNYSDKFVLYTEACTGCCGKWSPGPSYGDWSRGDDYAHDILKDLNHWSSGWVDWNLFLDLQGGPNWQNNFVDAAIIVNTTSDEFYKNPEYYALGHFSKFLTENSTRVLLNSSGINSTINLEATAFITPTNQRVMVINNRDSANNYTITVNDASINGKSLTLNLEASSFTTIVWNAPAACSCPSGAWYQSSVNPCNCYNFIKTPKDWTSANNDCQQQDPRSTLASIDSAFENNEVLVNGQNQTSCIQLFIGLQEPSTNVWAWINNDTSTYRNWRSGYPDGNANNKCSQLNTGDGKWINIDCSTTGCYVCEIKIN